MTRILLSPSAFYPSLGGVEEICRNLALQLLAQNFEVAIAVNRYPASLKQREEFDKIQVHRFAFEYPSKTFMGFGQCLRLPMNTKTFLDFVKDFAPDLVHVICPSSNAFYCWSALQMLKQKTLVTLQGEFFMDAHGLYQQSAFARLCTSKLLSNASGVTACSQYVMDDAKNRFAFNSPLEKVVFNGVDLSEGRSFSSSASIKKRFILGIGRLVANKGFDSLLRAFKLLTDVENNIDLVLAGDGEARADLETLSGALNLTDRVHFVGRQDREGVSALFNSCLFFVLPSHLEPFGIVCLEAMRAAKPIIATDVGGPPEFIRHNIDGLLVPPKNDTALFQAMRKLCSSEDLQKQFGQSVFRQVQNFDWSKITSQYIEIYNALLS